jgi:hypothetical protein
MAKKSQKIVARPQSGPLSGLRATVQAKKTRKSASAVKKAVKKVGSSAEEDKEGVEAKVKRGPRAS